MAIYHCSVKPISRSSGRTATAAAAYRACDCITDERTGEVHDYRRKSGLESASIHLPSGVSPAWAQDRSKLWNMAEGSEKRKNARVAREVELALPSELSLDERRALTDDMAKYLADRYCVAVDVSIHKPGDKGDKRNYHVHMLMSTRRITLDGFGEKTRELDDHQQGRIEVENIRAEWAQLANRVLEKAGQAVQIDHRSFHRQGVKRMPTVHLGVSACAMERRGEQTRLGDRNRQAQILNAQVEELEIEQSQNLERAKTHPADVDKQRILAGIEAFKAGYAAHKQEEAKRKREEAERERERQREQERAKKRTELAQERLKAMNRWLPTAKSSSNPEMAFAGHYRSWLEEEGKRAPYTLSVLQQADWIVTCRMLAQGHSPNALKNILRCTPAAAFEEREERESDSIVEKAMSHPEVQKQRDEYLRKKQEIEQERSRSTFSMGR